MQTTIKYHYRGHREDIGQLPIQRLLPAPRSRSIGPFVFLDHLLPSFLKPVPQRVGAHPHRGIATFTYALAGAVEHYDSSGHHGIVYQGGIQWMKAGTGIIHEENIPQTMKDGVLNHALQFWVNLPAKNKAEPPKYIPVQNNEVPEVILADQAGILRVLLGSYEQATSVIDTYSPQFLYHLILQPGAHFKYPTEPINEYAVYLPDGQASIDNQHFTTGELLVFNQDGDYILFENDASKPTNIILFGGEPYEEPIVSQGPFVMNNQQEIYQANQDYHLGKYGTINYINYNSSVKMVL